MKKNKWFRARFKSNADDFRPIYKGKNPQGPWWCSGYQDESAIIIAFVKNEETLLKQWPEAKEIDIDEVEKPTFSDRFPKPDWWIK